MVFVPVPFDRLIPYLVEGKGDIAADGMTITPERQKQAAFSDPYLTDIDEVVVTNKSVEDLTSLEDLAGRTVYVVKASSYAEHLAALNDRLTQRSLAAIDMLEALDYMEAEDLLELVNAGIIDYTVVDHHVAELWSNALTNLVIRKDLKVNAGGQIAWAVRKDNPKLREDLNRFVKGHRKGTLLGNIFFKRYYNNTKWVKSPTEAERKKLETLRQLFEKYATQYDFDWLMIAALAYQESGFNQNLKSRAGAVGIMQIKPSTAASRGVNIPNIDSLENNIHAGIKYLDWIANNYFNDPAISLPARVDFTLAAYNAGPTRVRRLQKQAAAMGYDPNVWFNNVEEAALKSIGWETVRYVANINKYYFAFKLSFHELTLREKLRETLKKSSD
jgi:membrane-bound lytic murein transglycosylase MltF